MTQPSSLRRGRRPRARALAGALAFGAGAGLACIAMAAEPGTWRTEDGRARVRVETCGPGKDRLCGYIVWLHDAGPDGRGGPDSRNPDRGKAARPLLGHQIMLGLAPAQGGHFAGKIYNAEDGKSYDVEVWEAQDGTLKVKGCLLIFCKTESWTRTADTVAGQLTGPTGSPNGPRPDPEWASGPAPQDRRGPGRRS